MWKLELKLAKSNLEIQFMLSYLLCVNNSNVQIQEVIFLNSINIVVAEKKQEILF